MLAALRFSNFKSWAAADLACAPITGLFGTNSSGKTSLIQFLLLMKQTKDATDRGISLELNGDLVQLGTIKDAIHQLDETQSMTWSIGFRLASELALSDPSRKKTSVVAKGTDLTLESEIAVQKAAPVARQLLYRLGEMSFSLAPKNGDLAQFDLKSSSDRDDTSDFTFLRTKGRPWQLPGPIKSYAFPDQARTYFQNAGFLADLEATYEAEIDKIFYLGPLRDYPKRDYLWARSRPTDVGQRGEKAIDAILAATEAGMERNLKSKARHKK
ncbi:MAG: hypothetical protein MUE49_13120, partial [Rhodospirillales bacterium]|nr:hypothetical protein [Rhodospirillales bacterium]